MKMFFKMMLVVSGFVFVGCGGGGGTSPVATIDGGDNSTSEVYKNKTLPAIDKNTVPDVLLKSTDGATEKLLKLNKSTEVSYGFSELKKNARFFYAMQLGMNMNLSYYDSVWSQVETYCEEKDVCNIPDGTIEFTYTNALYNHDVELIKAYEEKTGDTDSYGYFVDNGKELVGTKIALSSASLVRDENTEYENTLTSDILSLDENSSSSIGTSTLKWNKDNSKYLIRDEYYVGAGDNSYIQFTYNGSVEQKESEFTTNNHYTYGNVATLKFIEKDGRVYFIDDEPDDDELISFYMEGYLDDDGGNMTLIGAGESRYETFDTEGNILTSVQCIGQVTDFNNLSDGAYCFTDDSESIRSSLIEKRYFILYHFDINRTVLPDDGSQSYVDFLLDNTLVATIDCYNVTANYSINPGGISFSNINKVKDNTLQCYDSQVENKFVDFLSAGIDWSEGSDPGYNGVYDLDYYGLGQL